MNDDIKIRISTTADTTGINKASDSLGHLSKHDQKLVAFGERLNKVMAPLAGISAASGLAVYKLGGFMGDTVDEASKLQSALVGLNSIARAFGQDADGAKQAAQALAKDGLMTVADAASGLKNLLASGFSLDESIKLMTRFKDTAAFGRQGALSFGQAIVGATEGIKNGNSILVDNAGITKNLSIILKEAGFAENDLMRATSDANVRMALFNGLIKESNPMLGDAARLTELYAGKQAQAAAQTTVLKQNIGTAIQSALLPLLQAVTPIIQALAEFASKNQKLTAVILLAVTVFLGLIAILGTVGVAIAALTPIVAAFGILTIGWFVAIVAAVAAAAAAIIVNWDKVKRFFGAVIGYIRNNWQTIVPILLGPVGHAVVAVISRWSQVVSFFRSVPGKIRSAVAGVYDAIVSPFTRALNAVRGIADKIGNAASGVKNKIGNVASGIKDKIPGFATGVRNFSGGLAVVGERGPELVNLPKGSDVFSNRESAAMSGNRQTTIHNLNIFPQTAEAAREIFDQLDRDTLLTSKGFTPARGGA